MKMLNVQGINGKVLAREFDLNSAEDMIDLAQRIQSKVYWASKFYPVKDEQSTSYTEFWDHVTDAISRGAKKVRISEEDDVEFLA